MSLRIAIVHYHLRRGGVTRVIANAARALRPLDAETVILAGERPRDKLPAPACAVPALSYRPGAGAADPAAAAEQLREKARQAFGGHDPDIWHFHNHSLGKNAALPEILRVFVSQKKKLLLQIHDFAEDGRPGNYAVLQQTPKWEEAVYPLSPRVHYAVLNQRDRNFLGRAGAPPEQLHLLPNPVALPGDREQTAPIPPLPETDRLFLYPTRAIRRKNVGEFLLISSLGGKGDLFATTLAPDNPLWQPVHSRWARFAEELKLPVRLAIAQDSSHTFSEWVNAARALLTTSVAEGFGLAFLEPWLFGKSILGRNLPEITGDFTEAGIDLPQLYERLEVPLAWVDEETWNRRLAGALRKTYAAYGRAAPPDAAERARAAAIREGLADFGALDEPLQESVIEKVNASKQARTEIRPLSWSHPQEESVIVRNRQRVQEAYSLEAYGEKLAAIYRKLNEAPEAEPAALEAGKLLDAFLDPARFRLLLS